MKHQNVNLLGLYSYPQSLLAPIIKVLGVSGSLIFGLALPFVSRATPIVNLGWDLLNTQAGTTFMGVPFQGVNLGNYNFGVSPVGVGNADTIVRRLDVANAVNGPGPSQDIIPIELVALQLQSVIPVNLGAGLGYYYITLQSARGGSLSPGTMTINFGPEGNPHGTFDSFFDVFFDLRIGSLDGPIVFSMDHMLNSGGNSWSHQPSAGALLIDGVNHNLDGTNILNDFWPGAVITELGQPGTKHVVGPATVPDAGASFTLLLIALGFCGWGHLRARLSYTTRILTVYNADPVGPKPPLRQWYKIGRFRFGASIRRSLETAKTGDSSWKKPSPTLKVAPITLSVEMLMNVKADYLLSCLHPYSFSKVVFAIILGSITASAEGNKPTHRDGTPGAAAAHGGNGIVNETSPVPADFLVYLTGDDGKDLIPQPTDYPRFLHGVLNPATGQYEAKTVVGGGGRFLDVRDARNETLVRVAGGHLGGGGDVVQATSILNLEALFLDGHGMWRLENIFNSVEAHVGFNYEVIIPDLYLSDSRGNLLPDRTLYSLVDLNVFLPPGSSFFTGEVFEITGGVNPFLPGMQFSSTPFTFNSVSGFTGTPLTGAGVMVTAHGLRVTPVPDAGNSGAMLAASLLLLGSFVSFRTARRTIA